MIKKNTLILILFFYLISGSYAEEITNFPFYGLEDERYLIHTELESLNAEKSVLINFTSSNCKPCKIGIPELIKLHEKFK